MKSHLGSSFIFLIVIIVCVSGCSTTKNPLSPNSSSDPSEMALQISDFPDGYLKVKSEAISNTQDFQKMGTVTKGYAVTFSKGSTQSNIVFISQTILVMPVDQVNQVIPNFVSEAKKQGTAVTQLSNPDIGDSSIAYRAEDSEKNEIFMIIFKKQDVVEVIIMGGSQTDYEILKNLANKAEIKIK